MKVKVLSRSVASQQSPGSTIPRQHRNLDPALHPFERAREYTRALNAVKLERVFAAPFVAQLGRGHVDGVYSMATDPDSLQRCASGSGDGVVKVWDLTSRDEVWHAKAHENIVKSLSWTRDRKLLSCAADKTVKLWDPYSSSPGVRTPVATYVGQNTFTALSHHRSLPNFAVSSSAVSIYDLQRPSNAPIQTLHWPSSVDTITALAFNQVETSIIASAATDRSIVLYDLRTGSPLTKVTLSFASNAISWNPMEAFNFATASEDHNAYIFDMRRVDRALNVLRGHVAAVMDVTFDPTGEELATASYDRTVRLWEHRRGGQSRDTYHTKRMQRAFCARFTADAAYVLTGSDDGNVRVWRAHASDRQGVRSARQRRSLEYSRALVDRFQHMPEVRRIRRHRHVPKAVKKAGEIKAEELAAIRRREENRRKHAGRNGPPKRRSEREKMILGSEK